MELWERRIALNIVKELVKKTDRDAIAWQIHKGKVDWYGYPEWQATATDNDVRYTLKWRLPNYFEDARYKGYYVFFIDDEVCLQDECAIESKSWSRGEIPSPTLSTCIDYRRYFRDGGATEIEVHAPAWSFIIDHINASIKRTDAAEEKERQEQQELTIREKQSKLYKILEGLQTDALVNLTKANTDT